MGKILLLIVVLVGAVVMVPDLREAARPHVQFAFDPFYEWSTRNRVSEISKLVKRADQMGRRIPAPGEFSAFIDREDFQENASLDPWGTPYYLVRTRGGYQVGSAGKDRQSGTADDIVSAEEKLVNQPDDRDRRRRRTRR